LRGKKAPIKPFEEEAPMQPEKDYAFATTVQVPYEETVSRVINALKEAGFGVLTEIDVKATLKKKLNVDFRKYVILGACNPPYAHQTLQADLDVGLLLPCNVVVYETDDNKSHVSAINPIAALKVIENQKLKEIAAEVSEKLKKVIEKVSAGS
jgi:uncharacterized protein (DUF302 family)